MPKTGIQTAFFERAITFVVRGRLADSGRHTPSQSMLPKATHWSNIRLSEAKLWFQTTCRAVSSNSRALRGYHAGILTMVLRLRITMSALPLKAYMLSVSIDVRLVP